MDENCSKNTSEFLLLIRTHIENRHTIHQKLRIRNRLELDFTYSILIYYSPPKRKKYPVVFRLVTMACFGRVHQSHVTEPLYIDERWIISSRRSRSLSPSKVPIDRQQSVPCAFGHCPLSRLTQLIELDAGPLAGEFSERSQKNIIPWENV